MDLEKRVQQLEEELEILKHQIQTTLLDIQEQLLTNTYPSLRSENPPSPPNPNPPSQPVMTYTPPPVEPNYTPVEAAPVNVRKVCLDDLTSPNPAPEQSHPIVEEEQYQDIDMQEYRRWVKRNIREVGLKETRNMIRGYAQEGLLQPQVRDELLQVAAQYASKSAKATQRKPAPRKQAAPARSAVAPQRQSVKMTTPVYTQSDDITQPNRSQIFPTPEPIYEKRGDEMNDASSNLILRLMAGVQNAGAGVKWSKKKDG
ncbi:MAG: hypothetical protein H6672_07315 [Anaerolineaceae bacterium]|nr:hypothetical protein [Anaerolineaceae bacterium]